jgi:hypothetical protein
MVSTRRLVRVWLKIQVYLAPDIRTYQQAVPCLTSRKSRFLASTKCSKSVGSWPSRRERFRPVCPRVGGSARSAQVTEWPGAACPLRGTQPAKAVTAFGRLLDCCRPIADPSALNLRSAQQSSKCLRVLPSGRIGARRTPESRTGARYLTSGSASLCAKRRPTCAGAAGHWPPLPNESHVRGTS